MTTRPSAAQLASVAATLLAGETSRDGLVAIGAVRIALAVDTAAELWEAASRAAMSEDGRVPLEPPPDEPEPARLPDDEETDPCL